MEAISTPSVGSAEGRNASRSYDIMYLLCHLCSKYEAPMYVISTVMCPALDVAAEAGTINGYQDVRLRQKV